MENTIEIVILFQVIPNLGHQFSFDGSLFCFVHLWSFLASLGIHNPSAIRFVQVCGVAGIGLAFERALTCYQV